MKVRRCGSIDDMIFEFWAIKIWKLMPPPYKKNNTL